MKGAITHSTRFFTDLGLTKEEFISKYPLTYAEVGDEFVDYWVLSKPQRFNGSYLVAVKTGDV